MSRRPVPPSMGHYKSSRAAEVPSAIGAALSLNMSTHSQGDSEGSHGVTSPPPKDVERMEIEAMAANETFHVRVWRLILMLVMLGTGAMVATGTFLYIRQQEEDERLASYTVFTDTVSSASATQFHDFAQAQYALAQSITVAGISAANADATNAKVFPFVRVPMFEVHGGHTRQFSGVEVVAWCPLVTQAQRTAWAEFVLEEQGWYEESLYLGRFTDKDSMRFQDGNEGHSGHDVRSLATTSSGGDMRSFIWNGNSSSTAASWYDAKDDAVHPAPSGSLFAPVWQTSPPPFSKSVLNYNVLSEPSIEQMLPALNRIRHGLVTATNPNLHNAFHHHDRHLAASNDESNDVHPHSSYLEPVFDGLDRDTSELVGVITSTIAWDFFLSNLLPDSVTGMVAVLEDTCDEAFTFVLHGEHADFLGKGDLHDAKYDHTKFTIPVIMKADDYIYIPGQCVYSFSLYFSDAFRSESQSHLAVICTTLIGTIFALMAGAFFMYDKFVHRRNIKIVGAAVTSNAFLSTLFPSQVKKRLLAEEGDKETAEKGGMASGFRGSKPSDRASTLDNPEDLITYKSKPIADLFTETTILFADIVGFSAWSSVREPSQVFMFLETLFRAFDDIAKKRHVFKVETVGDCYVAVAGLPDVRKDHAVVMARFARECMVRMRTLSRQLEVTFGPDTGDLALRMGMHSGPVTAGVLRGDRSRFQLFGDTMNTAGRMEQNGLADKIHVSHETANLLMAAGKERWLSPRVDVVYSKDRGEMQTFWLDNLSRTSETSSQRDGSTDDKASDDGMTAPTSTSFSIATVPSKKTQAKTLRLVKWSEDVLLRLLKQIVARRRSCPAPVSERSPPNEGRYNAMSMLPVDEVADVIHMPRFKANPKQPLEDSDTITLDPAVVPQLRSFVLAIASLYEEHDYHNFEHASHVAMSVVKLLSRIVEPADALGGDSTSRRDVNASSLHDQTYGISSDPLTQLACVLAALVHNVNHPGVSNAQLVQEQHEWATQFRQQSMAEQHAVTVVWNLFMDPQYTLLRQTIYETDMELQRFRQVFVTATLATDLLDPQLNQSRRRAWERAFSTTAMKLTSLDVLNRRATIVVEYLLQASVVSHTMQHWHVYRKWNERLFLECYSAFCDGRHATNPVDEWYERELSSFDFTVLPLARQMQELGHVFGVSSDEYCNYALRNRHEWDKRGRTVVDEMVQRAHETLATRPNV